MAKRAQKDIGTCWFIHYSYQVDGITHEASIYLTDLTMSYFRYSRMKDSIQAWLNKMHDGDLNVVIRSYFNVPHKEGKEFWSNKPKES